MYSKLFKNINRPLAVITTITSWDEPPRFRHQVSRQVEKKYNILYVELFSSKRCCTRDCIKVVNDRFVILRLNSLKRVFASLYLRLPIFHLLVGFQMSFKIIRMIKKFNYSEALLINFQYDFREIMQFSMFSPKIYLCNDEFPNQLPKLWQKRMFSRYENQLIERSDMCIVHSYPLLEKFKGKHNNVKLLMPGHDMNIGKELPPAFIPKHSMEQIAVCYMGYIDKRILIPWLENILRQEQLYLYLVGPVKNNLDLTTLTLYPNIEILPSRVGDELQSILMSMDVCIIPFNIEQDVVKACTPNKLFQYIACGKPVVTSRMDQLPYLPEGFLYKAGNKHEFVDKIIEAKTNDNSHLKSDRFKLAISNSWDQRGEQLIEYISSVESKTRH